MSAQTLETAVEPTAAVVEQPVVTEVAEDPGLRIITDLDGSQKTVNQFLTEAGLDPNCPCSAWIKEFFADGSKNVEDLAMYMVVMDMFEQAFGGASVVGL